MRVFICILTYILNFVHQTNLLICKQSFTCDVLNCILKIIFFSIDKCKCFWREINFIDSLATSCSIRCHHDDGIYTFVRISVRVCMWVSSAFGVDCIAFLVCAQILIVVSYPYQIVLPLFNIRLVNWSIEIFRFSSAILLYFSFFFFNYFFWLCKSEFFSGTVFQYFRSFSSYVNLAVFPDVF